MGKLGVTWRRRWVGLVLGEEVGNRPATMNQRVLEPCSGWGRHMVGTSKGL